MIVVFDDDVIVDRNVVKILLSKSKLYPNACLSFSGWSAGTFPFLCQRVWNNLLDTEVDWIQGHDSILLKRKFCECCMIFCR